MPEGDTIHRTARTLHGLLAGRPITRFEVPRSTRRGPAPGTTVTVVEAIGKHLLIHLADGTVLHTHLGMTGSWHTYRPDQRWQRPWSAVRALIEVSDGVAVCFAAPTVEVLGAHALARHPALRRLGPDLCLADVPIDEILERFAARATAGRTAADLLLDQTVAAGIGNVYKSELLFLEGVHPAAPAAGVSSPTRRSLYVRAHELLRRNLDTIVRTTVAGGPDGATWVYGRGGRPCRRCRTSIAVAHQGDQARVTYWCPRCQPADE